MVYRHCVFIAEAPQKLHILIAVQDVACWTVHFFFIEQNLFADKINYTGQALEHVQAFTRLV